MKALKISLIYIAIFLVVIAILTEEVDARRKILKGRKTITRTYYRKAGIPAWAIIILVGFGQMLLGGILFLILKRKILDPPIQGSYSPAATNVR